MMTQENGAILPSSQGVATVHRKNLRVQLTLLLLSWYQVAAHMGLRGNWKGRRSSL